MNLLVYYLVDFNLKKMNLRVPNKNVVFLHINLESCLCHNEASFVTILRSSVRTHFISLFWGIYVVSNSGLL